MSAHAGDTPTHKTDPHPTNILLLTYRDLLTHYNSKYKEELNQKGKSGSAANNYETALNKWVEHPAWLNESNNNGDPRSASLEDPIGAEFGVDFEVRLAEHLRWMKGKGYAASSINS